jgi:phage replication-related protein YjqB (UPF0714/DUF867 family)
MRLPVPADDYQSFDELARCHTEGVDYAVHVTDRASPVAILAPHGGRIEGGTSQVARLIAGNEYGLYLFEGQRESGDNFHRLHLTSRCFDEPRCLELIARADTVITVHGYAARGPDVLLGGLDERFKRELATELTRQSVSWLAQGHAYPGRDRRNICNRGASGRGVQVELSAVFRRSARWCGLVSAVRTVLRQLVGCALPDEPISAAGRG